jgi:hypothetical protein
MPIVGDVLADRYRIESVLGVGGMASVYRATDIRLDRQVAVKVLVANLAADPQFAERFNGEAGAMAAFSHPNVAAVFDVEPGDAATGQEPFYVMEYCEGGSLADRLRVDGRIPSAELIPIVAAVAEGLAELHGAGFIHRDIKPANILFASGRPKLADFGVARSQGLRDGDPLTLPGTTLGTLPYLSPELAAGEPASAASDVFALGVTIFQSLTGQYPQPATGTETSGEPFASIPMPVSAAAPDLGGAFDAPLARALSVDPAARPSPTELAGQLAAGMASSGVALPNPGAIGAPYPPSGASPEANMEVPTVVAPAPPVPSAVPSPQSVRLEPGLEQPAVRRPAVARPGPASYGGWAILVVVLLVLAVLGIPRLLDDGGYPGASAGPSATAEFTALPTSAVTILDALGPVDAAIESARGGKDGLNGRDANELAQLAASVRTAVDRGDFIAARTSAGNLSDRGRALSTGLDKVRREALLGAIDGLLAAFAGLQ